LHERNWIRVVGHRDVPGKPELLGTTREFLDYFSLKKLDDLPTLAQLKELEDLRVQLTLPGAEPQVLTDPEGLSPLDAAADVELGADDEEEPSAESAEPRTHGLVARGALDDSI
jgi:segregation and condensation protein B